MEQDVPDHLHLPMSPRTATEVPNPVSTVPRCSCWGTG